MPLISIITVCRNAEATLECTIKSLVGQTFRDYEYLIIDGKSSDRTLDIVEAYRSNIDSLISEPDAGIYDAMNKGIGIAKGDFLYFLNSGDTFYDREVLSDIAGIIKSNTAVDAIVGDVMLISPTIANKQLHSHFFEDNFSALIKPFNHQSIFARRRMFDDEGGFNIQYPIFADFDWFIRGIRSGKYTYVKFNRVLCNYLVGGVSSHSATGSLAPERLLVLKENFNRGAIDTYLLLRKCHLARVLKIGFFRNLYNKYLVHGF